jgi:hypothetical protein
LWKNLKNTDIYAIREGDHLYIGSDHLLYIPPVL